MGPDFHENMDNATNSSNENLKNVVETIKNKDDHSSPAARIADYDMKLKKAKKIIRKLLEMHGQVISDLQPGANFLSGETIRAMNEIPAEAKDFLEKIETNLYSND